MNDRIDFRFLTAADTLWREVIAYARGCSWRAGLPFLRTGEASFCLFPPCIFRFHI